MTDVAPTGVDPTMVAAEVRRVLNAAGLSTADPEVRRAVIDAVSDGPLDKRMVAAEKRKYAVELRLAGASYREIARLVGYANPSSAHRTVMKALKDLPSEPAEQIRQLAVERLEGILSGGLYRLAKTGQVKPGGEVDRQAQMQAVDRVIAVMREERRYIPGVEVPANMELTGAGGGPLIMEFPVPQPIPVDPIPQGMLSGLGRILDVDVVSPAELEQ